MRLFLAALVAVFALGLTAEADAGQRRCPLEKIERPSCAQAQQVRRHRPKQRVVQQCADCAIDLPARFVVCLIRDGRKLWQYATSVGTFNMIMDRRGPADMIRLFPDGRVTWVAR